ncbi:MAG: HAD hydrolase-like protein [Patescibacteria group bacterium]|nr:HAD hydrolase-like protein [Patescibacteria group bacterium]
MNKTVIFDWKRTLYDPDSKTLINGVFDILEFLRGKKIKLVLIGKGGKEMFNEVKRLKVEKYFLEIIFNEGPKDETLYKKFVSPRSPGSTIFVGDRIRSELAIGNKLGAVTVWFKNGKFSKEGPLDKSQIPTHTIKSLSEVKSLMVF